MSIYRFTFEAMACGCELVFGAESPMHAQTLANKAMAEVKRVEMKYSRYLSTSVVSQINAQAGLAFTPCDEETWALLHYADTLYATSDGLFDITSGILRQAWDFKHAQLPTDAHLSTLLPLVNWPVVERVDQTIRLPRVGMQIDFGGFGKEYATDLAANVLLREGVAHGYINLGGDMRVLGPKLDGEPWTMGVQNPRNEQEVIAHIPIAYGALATSGDYERYFEWNGRRYCHLLNPQTGWPVQYWQSVSVLAPMAISAGSFTTIAMLKEEQGLAWLQASGMSYLVVDKKGQVLANAQPA